MAKNEIKYLTAIKTDKRVKKFCRFKKYGIRYVDYKDVEAKLNEGPIRLGAKSGTSGKIFGSVTSLQISRAIREQKGYEIDRKKISIAEEVKELGSYKAVIDFGNGKSAEVSFEVIAE